MAKRKTILHIEGAETTGSTAAAPAPVVEEQAAPPAPEPEAPQPETPKQSESVKQPEAPKQPEAAKQPEAPKQPETAKQPKATVRTRVSATPQPTQPEEQKTSKRATPKRAASADTTGASQQAAPAAKTPMGWVARTFPGHTHAVLGGIAGLLAAVLIFVWGFWQTLFVALLVFVGVALGQYLDGDPKIINFLRAFFAEMRGDEQG